MHDEILTTLNYNMTERGGKNMRSREQSLYVIILILLLILVGLLFK